MVQHVSRMGVCLLITEYVRSVNCTERCYMSVCTSPV